MEEAQFQWISRSPAEIAQVVSHALTAKREALDAILAIPESERTFLNTVAALEYADDELADTRQQLDLLLSVHPDEDIRSAAQSAVDRIDVENVKMNFDRRLWDAVQAWAQRREPLDTVDQKLTDDTIRDMRRMGFALSDSDFDALKRNTMELQQLQTTFEKAINDWEDHILVSRDQLSGMPDRYINALTREGEWYRVTLAYPDLFPFMRLADNDAARRELATKNLLKGGHENLERLARMIGLRQENARLLGFATHADFATQPRMARTGEVATTFVRSIANRLESAAQRERNDLVDIKRRTLDLQKPTPLGFHETAYWGYKLLRERYDINPERVKEYLPLQRVIDEMLAIYQEVLGVAFERIEGVRLWHEDAQLFALKSEGESLGHFVLDLYPRKGKYGHAAAFPAVLGRWRRDGTQVKGLVALVCNFPKQTLEHPSLLSHDEVETLLHEFGHVMHALLSGGRWQSQNGFGVPLDFVEALSQLFEEWAWNPSVLKRISGHYQTGEPMPEDLVRTVIAARHHMDANFYLQQAVKALYDLQIHSQPADAPVDAQLLAQQYRALKLEREAVEIPEGSLFPAGWGHMADYDAGYYGYLWSKVYALDMYSRFAADPLNVEIGSTYRRLVLEPGASKNELELVRAFLGREPSDEPFLTALGISENIDKK